jgi:glycosyltransferase involved in cell wall biosynthesis
LVIGVPELHSYQPHNGIGRVFCTVSSRWQDRVQLVDARFEAHPVPVLRGLPFAVRPPEGANLVLLPKLTGARALRDTLGVPSVAVVHDVGVVDYPGDREGINWLNHQMILRSFRGLRHASHVIAVSRFTRDRLLHYLPELESKVSVVPNPVNDIFLGDTRTRVEARDRIGRLVCNPLTGPVMIYVGGEAPRKNIALLLRVLRRVKDRLPGTTLLKVGSPGRPKWRAATVSAARSLGLGPGKDILILEDVDDAVLADAYRAADVFISTSLYEGFGLPALEAMAIGTPVVVTNRGSFPEIVGEAGRVVEPEIEPFARAVEDVLTDQQSSTSALKRQARAARFAVAEAADRYLRVMEQLAR